MDGFKVGDRVVIIYKGCNYSKTGTVMERRYNKNMAAYGKGNEVLVKIDGYESGWIYYEKDLKKKD